MYEMHRFVDKVAVVTGGAKGIGRACCLRFAREGARVAALDVVEAEAQATATECAGLCGQPSLALRCDVTDQESVRAAFAAVVAAWGGLDILVASAGIYSSHPLTEVPLPAWQKVIDVDLTGVFLADQAAARAMIETGRGMAIINISSMAGRTSWPSSAQYSAAKSGIIGLTRSVAMEMADHCISANTVCPGNTLTEMAYGVAQVAAEREGLTPDEWIAVRSQDCPMKRYATVDEIAAVVAFLASDEARYITGQTIGVDGGMVLS